MAVDSALSPIVVLTEESLNRGKEGVRVNDGELLLDGVFESGLFHRHRGGIGSTDDSTTADGKRREREWRGRVRTTKSEKESGR
jgi:hypothetical protein